MPRDRYRCRSARPRCRANTAGTCRRTTAPGTTTFFTGETLEQVRIVERMIVGGNPEQDRVLPRELVEQEGAADDAGDFLGVLRDVAVIVDAVADAEPVEPRTEIEKHAKLAAHARLAEQHAAHHAPQMPVAGKPAVVLVLVEQVEDHVVGIVVECLGGHWVHPRQSGPHCRMGPAVAPLETSDRLNAARLNANLRNRRRPGLRSNRLTAMRVSSATAEAAIRGAKMRPG